MTMDDRKCTAFGAEEMRKSKPMKIRWYEWPGRYGMTRVLQVLTLDNIWVDVPIVFGDSKPKIQYGIGHPLNSKEPEGYA